MHMRILTLVCLTAAPLVAQDTLAASIGLIPKPREISHVSVVSLKSGVAIDRPTDSDDRFAATELADALKLRGVPVAAPTPSLRVTLLRANSASAKTLLTKEKLAFTD